MACITLLAQPLSMATTQFTRATCFEAHVTGSSELSTQPVFLRMNWVVVSGKSGRPRLRAQWMTTGDNC